MRRGAGMHGDERLGRRDRVLPFGRIRENRCRVAVFAHAEHGDIGQLTIAARDFAVQRGNAGVERLRRIHERKKCGLTRGMLQQRLAHEAGKLAKVSVTAQVVAQTKGPKISIHKYKNKTGYHKRMGHRQPLTQVKVTGITTGK